MSGSVWGWPSTSASMLMLKASCSGGVLEQVVQHLVRVGVALELDDHAHAVAVGLVAQVGDAVDLLVLDQLGDLLEQGRLVDLVRQLGDDDRRAVAARSPRTRPAPASPPGRGRGRTCRGWRRWSPARRSAGCAASRSGRSCRRSGSPGPGRTCTGRRRCSSGLSIRAIVASTISPRLWGGMLVAMPTAMPDAPLTSRFGQLGRQDRRLLPGAVVVVDEVDGVLVDVGQHLVGDRASGAPRCSASPPAGRRRPSRSCPGRRPAGSASRSPAPGGPARRRARRRRAGGTCPSPRRRSRRTCGSELVALRPISSIAYRIRRWTGLRPSRTSGQRARDDDAHRVVEVRARISSSMRMARTSPRSSVTWWVSSGGHGRGDDRAVRGRRVEGLEPGAQEAGRRRGGDGRARLAATAADAAELVLRSACATGAGQLATGCRG